MTRSSRRLLPEHLPLIDRAAAHVDQVDIVTRLRTGVPPHRWMTLRRVDKAKELMRTATLRTAEISLVCRFADQSHFTRVFCAVAGRTLPSRSRVSRPS